MQFTRNMAQRRFLRRDQLLCEFAALIRKEGELSEKAPIRANQIQAGEQDCGQDCDQKQVDLALYAVVNLRHLVARLLIALVVLDQQPCDRGAQRRLPRLQGNPNLSARSRFVTVAREREHAIDSVPELREGTRKELALLRRLARDGELSLTLESIAQIGADALELRAPGCERIRFLIVEHVA